MSSTAPSKAVSFVFDGLLKPVTFLTYCSEAALISSSVAGGAKLKRVLMFLHMALGLQTRSPTAGLVCYQYVFCAKGAEYELRVHRFSSRCPYRLGLFDGPISSATSSRLSRVRPVRKTLAPRERRP